MRARTLTAIAVSLASAQFAAAQPCEPGWQPGFGWDPPAQASLAITTASPLGREIIVVGGEFTSSVLGRPLSHVASFDGATWDDLHGGADATVRAIATWDPDGAGGQSELVVAAGDFRQIGLAAPGGAVAADHVAAWDGSAWRPIGEGAAGPVSALAVVDFDGDGDGDLFATSLANGTENVVQRLDAGRWREIGRWSAPDQLRILKAWDRDGPGGQPATLVAADDRGIRVWAGAQWEDLPAPALFGPPWAAGTLDRDGSGPLPPSLFIASLAGVVQMFVGEEWREVYRTTLIGVTRAMDAVDPDGPGPASERLYFGSHSTGQPSYSLLAKYPGAARIYTYAYLDLDVITGIAARAGGAGPPEIWLARETPDFMWHPGSVSWIFDSPDAPMGPLVEFRDGVVSLAEIPGLELIGLPGVLYRRDGRHWWKWAEPDAAVHAAVSEDERRLFIGGSFSEVNGQPMRGVAMFDGKWRPVGDGPRRVYALAFGDLGEGRRLYAAGSDVTGLGEAGVAEWDGERWTTLGIMDGFPNDMIFHDADGAGPAPGELVVGGRFEEIGGAPISNVAAFDGRAWRPLGAGFETVGALASHDPDGAGPLPAAVYALDAHGWAWRFVGGGWELVGGGGPFYDIHAFDPDGPGPQPALLFAAREDSRLARLDNGMWIDHAQPAPWSGPRPKLSSVNVLRGGRLVPALAVTGGFLAMDDEPSAGVALWIGNCPCPADCDGDGELTFQDFLCFQDRFAARDPQADCDGDVQFTFFDLLCFQNGFAGGCS